MNSNSDLNGRVVIVTGAGSGLGEAVAHAFGRAGAAVACLDLNEAAAERVRREVGGHSLALRCDVSDADALFGAVESVAQHLGRVDVVVSNAAVDYTLSVEELSVEQWDQEIAVNLRAAFLLAKAVWPLMRRQGGGHLVNVASTAAVRAWANASPYHASKRGLVGFSRSLGVEGRPHNIRVTTVIPGGMRTHFFDRFEAQGIPLPDPDSLQEPANVAETILFAVRLPAGSALQELIVTPLSETSWP